MNGLIVSIYKAERTGDCTNGGVSSKATEALLIGDGVSGPFEESSERPTLKLVRRNLFGREYLHAEPIDPPTGVGWMAGGNFIWTSDSRFPNDYPIAVHDRQESQDQYNMLSR
jgi:hypothetical protein